MMEIRMRPRQYIYSLCSDSGQQQHANTKHFQENRVSMRIFFARRGKMKHKQ